MVAESREFKIIVHTHTHTKVFINYIFFSFGKYLSICITLCLRWNSSTYQKRGEIIAGTSNRNVEDKPVHPYGAVNSFLSA